MIKWQIWNLQGVWEIYDGSDGFVSNYGGKQGHGVKWRPHMRQMISCVLNGRTGVWGVQGWPIHVSLYACAQLGFCTFNEMRCIWHFLMNSSFYSVLHWRKNMRALLLHSWKFWSAHFVLFQNSCYLISKHAFTSAIGSLTILHVRIRHIFTADVWLIRTLYTMGNIPRLSHSGYFVCAIFWNKR